MTSVKNHFKSRQCSLVHCKTIREIRKTLKISNAKMYLWTAAFHLLDPRFCWRVLLIQVCPSVCSAFATQFSQGWLFTFFWISHEVRVHETLKSGVTLFWEKFLFCLKWGKWGIFGPEINNFELFSKSFYYIFLTAIWLSHGQPWPILEGTASLTQC